MLKTSGMYIFAVLQLSARLLILMWIASLAFSGNLFTVLIYYFEVGDVDMRVVVGFTVDVNCTCYMTAMSFHSIF